MIKSIRHLRGYEDDWENCDAVIPDGEIAILKTHGGLSKIKIGNGIDKFSALPSLTGDSVNTSEREITLMHGKRYRLGECESVALKFPAVIDDDYYSEVSFDSGIYGTEFSTDKRVRLSGDGVANEKLLPNENTHYTVFIWYDGELQGIVRGIPNV